MVQQNSQFSSDQMTILLRAFVLWTKSSASSVTGGSEIAGGAALGVDAASAFSSVAYGSARQHTSAYVSIRQIAGGAALGVDTASAVSSVDIVGICTFVLVKQVK